MIISTGIAGLEDIEEALDACYRVGNYDITLLQCTSSYPAPIEEANLSNIQDLKTRFNVKSGLSDHTLGITVPIAAVALGAFVIEKHFILDRNQGGPDSTFSLEPQEFKAMVQAIRDVEKAIGKPNYDLNERKLNNRKMARSIFVVKDVKKGENFSYDNIKSIRPGDGLPPKYLNQIIGKTATMDLIEGTPLKNIHFN
jgi:pseudaminic acid synthase